MIKWLALLLIGANAGLWAWTHGWLSPTLQPPGESQREPQRLQQHVRPESIVILSPRAASAALEQIAAAEAAASAAATAASAPPVLPAGRPAR